MVKINRRFFARFEKFIFAELLWMVAKYLRASLSNPNLKPLRWIIRKNLELLINRTKVIRADNSFANESKTLKEILDTLDTSENYLVDIGAADGIRQSSTSLFLNQLQWSGAMFEFDTESFSRLAFLYNDRSDINLHRGKVTPLNVANLFEGMEVPKKFALLNIDIDSYDLSVLRALITSGFRPTVISMEINESIPPDVYFEIEYHNNHTWEGNHFFGCSLAAAYESLTVYGYKLIRVEYNNAIFLAEEDMTANVKPKNIKKAYDEGYASRADRKEIFPWNHDTEVLQKMKSSSEKIDFINGMFREYFGRYVIRPTNIVD